jgi:hypothetical protein
VPTSPCDTYHRIGGGRDDDDGNELHLSRHRLSTTLAEGTWCGYGRERMAGKRRKRKETGEGNKSSYVDPPLCVVHVSETTFQNS